MTFTYKEADLSTIIERYTQNNNFYRVHYLDGNFNEYYCSDPDEPQRLEQIMIDQAIDRQGMFDIEEQKRIKNLAFTTAGISLACYSSSNNIGLTLLTSIGIATGLLGGIKRIKRLNELNKYKLFLEMYKDLPYIDESELLASVEFEKIYQIPLTINTLDQYSYGSMKLIYKKFNSMVYE